MTYIQIKISSLILVFFFLTLTFLLVSWQLTVISNLRHYPLAKIQNCPVINNVQAAKTTTPKPDLEYQKILAPMPKNISKIIKTRPSEKPKEFKEPNCVAHIGHKGDFPIIPLISLPGAGNTWVRFLIEQSTGFLTGSYYNDKRLYKSLKGELQDWLQQETIAVKDHSINGLRTKLNKIPVEKRPEVSGCILIIRNPRDAIFAQYNNKQAHGHTAIIGAGNLPENATSQEIEENIKNHLLDPKSAWREVSDRVAGNFRPIYSNAHKYCHHEVNTDTFLIIYEELKESKEKVYEIMENLTNYINKKNKNYVNSRTGDKLKKIRFRRECLEKNFEGNYHRKTGREWDLGPYFSKTAVNNINYSVDWLNKTFLGVLPGDYIISENNNDNND